jgi:hypothetical protein
MTGSSAKKSVTTSRSLSILIGVITNVTRFHDFFHHVDHYRTEYFLWVTATGISAAKQSKAKDEDVSEDEDVADPNGQEG